MANQPASKDTTNQNSNSNSADAPKPETTQNQPSKQLEEDDEFEDFPVEDWPDEETDMHDAAGEGRAHLWEESWDDDEKNEDFAAVLREELKKVGKR